MSFKKIGSKKRSGSCPPIDQGGSLQTDNGCKTVVASNCSESVHVNDCGNVTEVASENDASRNPVCSRVFTNSNLSTRVVNALMARGNKYKTLNNMKCNNVAGQKISQVTVITLISVNLKPKYSEIVQLVVKRKTTTTKVKNGDTGQLKIVWKLTSALKVERPSFYKINPKSQQKACQTIRITHQWALTL